MLFFKLLTRRRSADHTAGDNIEPGGQFLGAGQIMGGHHHCASVGGDRLQYLIQHGRGILVEAGVGLIEEHHIRVMQHGPADGEPLLHTAREGAGQVAPAVLQPNHFQDFGDARLQIGNAIHAPIKTQIFLGAQITVQQGKVRDDAQPGTDGRGFLWQEGNQPH